MPARWSAYLSGKTIGATTRLPHTAHVAHDPLNTFNCRSPLLQAGIMDRLRDFCVGATMFDVEDVLEGISIWLNACARMTHAWTLALDQASAFFAQEQA
jgi:hypothetical protein